MVEPRHPWKDANLVRTGRYRVRLEDRECQGIVVFWGVRRKVLREVDV